MAADATVSFRWLTTGDDAFRAAEEAIDAAKHTVRLEVYIYADSPLGQRVRDRLVRAAMRGVQVRVLVDGIGSLRLSSSFWTPLIDVGGQIRVFNPLNLKRFAVRDHRKLLVCDEAVAIIGGFNIAPEYEGDGVERGWCDLALQIEGGPVTELAASFDDMFEHAEFRHGRILSLRRPLSKKLVPASDWQLLLSGPGRGRNPLLRMLHRDLAHVVDVQIVAAYFLPTLRLRHKLIRIARLGGKVKLILPSKTDVQLSQLAAQCLYTRLLRSGVEIYEYQPQILHAKLLIIGNAVYVGSANLDPRSLRINYDLMVRFQDATLAAQARTVFDGLLSRSRRVELGSWRRSRSWWQKLKQQLAYYLLVRVDPYIAAWQYRRMKR